MEWQFKNKIKVFKATGKGKPKRFIFFRWHFQCCILSHCFGKCITLLVPWILIVGIMMYLSSKDSGGNVVSAFVISVLWYT